MSVVVGTLLVTWIAMGTATAATSGPAHTALVLLLDRSGSMRTSDPGCVRAEAAELLIDQLRDGDLVNVAEFGNAVVPLLPQFVALSKAARQNIATRLAACAAADPYTDIAAALNYALGAAQSLSADQRRAYPVHVVLLTDGRYEPAVVTADADAVVRTRLLLLHELGATVHGLGLGSGTDRQLLGQFSELTSGRVTYANAPRDLVAGFLEFTRLLGRRWLVEDRIVQGAGATKVALPPWATRWYAAYVPAGLPGGITFDGAAAAIARSNYLLGSGERRRDFVEVTLTAPGRLLVDVTGELALSVDMPRVAAPGVFFKCGARLLSPSHEPLGSPRFLQGATIAVEGSGSSAQLHDDGQHGDGAAADGAFAGSCAFNEASRDVQWTATLSSMFPVLDPPTASGVLHVEGVPLMLSSEGLPRNALSAALGLPVSARLLNATDTPLAGRLLVGAYSVGASVAPRGATRLFLGAAYATARWTSEEASFVTEPEGRRFGLGVVSRQPRALLPAVCLGALTLIAFSFAFPRRSAEGSTVTVRGQAIQAGIDGFSAVGRIDSAGSPVFRDTLPPPLGDPGRVTARQGLWRRGVLYVPAPWITPIFAGHVAGTKVAGYRITRVASWTCHHGAFKVTYTLTPSIR